MGLDMYLIKKTYVKNYSFMSPEELTKITIEGGRGTSIKPERITYIEEELAYWRKANHIHHWFVENVQDGEDDCRLYCVTLENLINLVETCEKVLINNDLAQELLPVRQGFFFGSYGYDEGYFEDVKYTYETIKEIINDLENNPSYDEIYYKSSW